MRLGHPKLTSFAPDFHITSAPRYAHHAHQEGTQAGAPLGDTPPPLLPFSFHLEHARTPLACWGPPPPQSHARDYTHPPRQAGRQRSERELPIHGRRTRARSQPSPVSTHAHPGHMAPQRCPLRAARALSQPPPADRRSRPGVVRAGPGRAFPRWGTGGNWGSQRGAPS